MQFKYINIILLSLFCLDSFCQSVANWTVGNEASISQYEVQKSADTINWTRVATISKGKSVYTYTLPAQNMYYRIKGVGKDTFYTRPILIPQNATVVTITNATIKTTTYQDNLSWIAANETKVNYYQIERSINSGTYNKITTAKQKGTGKYNVSVSRYGKVRDYRVYAMYKDGTKSVNVNFK